MKSLPIGISTLKFLIQDKMVYVDKTGVIAPLVKDKGRYFLSRPRRFGKSLLIDTFKELFEGNEVLFRGLAIHDSWDWSKKYPVIKIDFAGGVLRSRTDLQNKLAAVLNWHCTAFGITLAEDGLSNRFKELIQKTRDKTGSQVVVLVDEYDKPLLDNIEDPDRALVIRDALKDLYSSLKEADSLLQFVFLTGVSKFSKVNIFSGINNLKDLTLDANYATICGYTQADLETVFAEHLAGVDWEELRLWYNGYNFLGEPVYNPFDILLFISENHNYRNFWFQSGTPTFLVKLLQKNRYFLPDLENIEVSDNQLDSFEVDSIPPAVLLFQSGYLTIASTYRKMNSIFYRLKIPNQEVVSALSNSLFSGYTLIQDQQVHFQTGSYDAMLAGNLGALEATLRRMFHGIPWRNFTNNDIADYEGYYASVLYAFFVSITGTIIPEDTTNHGQADLTVRLENNIYVMEIKVIAGEKSSADAIGSGSAAAVTNSALEQIRSRDYARKYLGQSGVRVFELGLVFSQSTRNLVQFAGAERV